MRRKFKPKRKHKDLERRIVNDYKPKRLEAENDRTNEISDEPKTSERNPLITNIFNSSIERAQLFDNREDGKYCLRILGKKDELGIQEIYLVFLVPDDFNKKIKEEKRLMEICGGKYSPIPPNNTDFIDLVISEAKDTLSRRRYGINCRPLEEIIPIQQI